MLDQKNKKISNLQKQTHNEKVKNSQLKTSQEENIKTMEQYKF